RQSDRRGGLKHRDGITPGTPLYLKRRNLVVFPSNQFVDTRNLLTG
ncbi:5490_t:CDS:1, partial [Cetraspora pellucida]